MDGETVQPIATILISPFLKEWYPRVTFSNPSDWNYSRLALMILWKYSNIFHTDGYPEYLGIGGQDVGVR